MIPLDLASRSRLILDSQVQAPTAAPEIPSELPALNPGQRITARLESALANGNFRAVVDGKMVNLSVATSNPGKPVEQVSHIGPGQTLELVVTGQNQRTVFARVAEQAVSDTPVLSRSAQIIGSLLARGNPEPAALAKGAPLMPAPSPEAFQALPQQLRQAVAESGLFYESHQAQWLAGKLPATSLLREPQGSHSPLATTLQAAHQSALASRSTINAAEPSTTTSLTAPQGQAPASVEGGEATPVPARILQDQAAALPQAQASANQASKPAPTTMGTQLANLLLGITAEGDALPTGQQATQLQPGLPFRALQGMLLYTSEQTKWEGGPVPDTRQIAPNTQQASTERPLSQSASGTPTPPGQPTITTAPQSAQATESRSSAAAAALPPAHAQPVGPMPAELQPLVQQQLNAADSRQMFWQGQVWPGQNMEWRIEEDTSGAPEGEEAQPKQWKTSLRLTMPNLGQLNAILTLGTAGVSVKVATDQVEALRQAAPALADALAAAGVPAISVQIITNEQA